MANDDTAARNLFPSVFEILDAEANVADEQVMITEALPVQFTEEFSPLLAAKGAVFEIIARSNAAHDIVEHPLYLIEAKTGRPFVTVRTKVTGRWTTRLAFLDTLRTADGREIVTPGRSPRQAAEDAIIARDAN